MSLAYLDLVMEISNWVEEQGPGRRAGVLEPDNWVEILEPGNWG